MTLPQRIAHLLSQKPTLTPWVGDFTESSLLQLIDSEIGDHRRLHTWIEGSRVIPRAPILHILSGNTQHAAFQSLFRAFLIGCPKNLVKLPSTPLPEFEAWATNIPNTELSRDLPETWRNPELAILYGNTETLHFFHNWLTPGTRIIPHGPKISAAFIFSNQPDDITPHLAQDILAHAQRGCLSLQMIYYQGDDIETFCQNLATSMRDHLVKNPSPELTPSEAGNILNTRELTRFRIANGESLKIWHSQNTPDYTVILDPTDPHLRPTSPGGLVRVTPMPPKITPETLGPEIQHLSTAICHPISHVHLLEPIQPPRICPPGQAQHPPITWHPDGESPLTPLLKWRDLHDHEHPLPI